MNAVEEKERGAAEGGTAARLIFDPWAESLAQVLESMADQRPAVEWRTGSGPVAAGDAGEPLLWWEQPFKGPEGRGGDDPAGMRVWIAAPRATWEYAGTATLKAAGLETVAETDARNTWLEILSQSLGTMARAIGAAMGHEVTCDTGAERAPDPQPPDWASVSMRFAGGSPLPLAIAAAPYLLSAMHRAAAAEEQRQEVEEEEDEEAAAPPPNCRSMDLLLDVDLPISISFGKTQLALHDVLKLTTGSIVELHCGVNDQVEVLVNHCLVARGEVVVVEGNYGVRILEIASRRDRLRGLR